MVALLVLLTVLMFLTVDYFVQRRRGEFESLSEQPQRTAPLVTREPEYRTPAGVFFNPTHTWAFLDESGNARVGVDDVVRTVLGTVDRVDVLPAGRKVKRGEKLLELFHGDRSVVVESPFDGVVERLNKDRDASREHAALVEDWLCEIRPRDTSTVPQTMLLGDRARTWIKRELRRLRVFLSTVAPENPVLAQTMQDGGMPYAGLAEYLGEEDWTKLQAAFFRHAPR